jgi:hypothetical protein
MGGGKAREGMLPSFGEEEKGVWEEDWAREIRAGFGFKVKNEDGRGAGDKVI